MFLHFLVSLIEVRRVFPHDIFKFSSDQWQTLHVPYGKTSYFVFLGKKKKNKKSCSSFFWIKIAVGYVTLENWEICFQMGGLAQWLYAFFLYRITFSKVLLTETATYCKNLLKISNLLQKPVKQWHVEKC